MSTDESSPRVEPVPVAWHVTDTEFGRGTVVTDRNIAAIQAEQLRQVGVSVQVLPLYYGPEDVTSNERVTAEAEAAMRPSVEEHEEFWRERDDDPVYVSVPRSCTRELARAGCQHFKGYQPICEANVRLLIEDVATAWEDMVALVASGFGGVPVRASAPVVRVPEVEWTDEDRPLPEDLMIQSCHPAITTKPRHDLYAEALRMVGAKRSKGALVELVHWLLYRIAEGEPESAPKKAIPDFAELLRSALPQIGYLPRTAAGCDYQEVLKAEIRTALQGHAPKEATT